MYVCIHVCIYYIDYIDFTYIIAFVCIYTYIYFVYGNLQAEIRNIDNLLRIFSYNSKSK